jgi:hypothetical protein
MITFEVKNKDMKEWFPETYNIFLDELRSSYSTCANKPEENISWMISWGFFGKKAKTQEEAEEIAIAYSNKLKLVYEDRVAVDMSKIRISVSMKAGYYIRVDRSFDTVMPKYITELSNEVLKITMLMEQEILQDPIVMESLKEFEDLLVPNDEGNDIPAAQKAPLSMDDILDKISEHGIASLSSGEKKFLDKMSRG